MTETKFAAEVQRDISALVREGECADDSVPAPNAAERDALDAQRYRWLRDNIGKDGRADVYILAPGMSRGDWGSAPQIKSGDELAWCIDDCIAGFDRRAADGPND